jgi:hypothetical protein
VVIRKAAGIARGKVSEKLGRLTLGGERDSGSRQRVAIELAKWRRTSRKSAAMFFNREIRLKHKQLVNR